MKYKGLKAHFYQCEQGRKSGVIFKKYFGPKPNAEKPRHEGLSIQSSVLFQYIGNNDLQFNSFIKWLTIRFNGSHQFYFSL